MKELKFRAWDKDNSTMVYLADGNDDYIWELSWSGMQVLCEEQIVCTITGTISKKWVPANVEIMQFTGLKDKNGVEIYEDDLVSYDGHWPHYKINMYQGEWRLDQWYNLYDIQSKIKVIGNIYEQNNQEDVNKTS